MIQRVAKITTKIMEIVEGSTQIQQMTIARYAYQYFTPTREPAPTR